jgi:hypothetical protein
MMAEDEGCGDSTRKFNEIIKDSSTMKDIYDFNFNHVGQELVLDKN